MIARFLRGLDWVADIVLPDDGQVRPEMLAGVMILQVVAFAMVGIAIAVILGLRP